MLNYKQVNQSIWKTKLACPRRKIAFEKRIREIKKLGINPVSLLTDWNINQLPNLYGIIIESFKTAGLDVNILPVDQVEV